MAPLSIVGTTLVFDRDGRRLAVVESDAISLVDLVRTRTRRIDHAEARAVALFDDQLWIATRADQLERLDLEGHVLGEPCALGFASSPLLVAAACGPAAAVWHSSPAVALVDDFGQLARAELADADAIIPLTGRRHLVARGSKVALPSGVVAQLAPGATVIGGTVLHDGKTAVLLVAHAAGRSLATVSLSTGQLAQRCAAATGAVRVAARRAMAVVQRGPRALAMIDLRTGGELGAVSLDRDIRDFAIDPGGQRLAVRHGERCVEIHELAALLRASTPEVEPAPEVAEPIAAVAAGSSAEIVAVVDERPAVGPFECPRLAALGPRSRPGPIDRAGVRAQLDRELRGVALWTLQAIAAAWDTRRLGYGNEGRHPYELEVAAILGLHAGHAADYVAAARDRIADHEAAVAADPQHRAIDTPLGALAAEFGLTACACDVLMVIAAAALWGETARLYGILANDTARGLDELVVQQVLAPRHDRHDVAAALDPRAPLTRFGLVNVSTRRARPFSELAVDPVVLDLLRGVAPDLGPATTVRIADRALASLDVPRPVLDRAVAALAREPLSPVRVVVRGRAGTGRTTLLASLAGAAGRDLAVIDARCLPRAADAFVAELRRALCRSQLAGFLPCVVQLDDVTFDEHPARVVAAETLRAHPGLVAVASAPDVPSPFTPGHVEIELPVLAETERRVVWQRALAERGLVADVDALAARYRVGPGMIRRATAAAADVATDDATAALDHYIRQTRDARLSQYARRVERLATWSNVVLPPDILDSLRELVGRVRHRRTVFEAWGMARTMTSSRGLTALFQGSPGTGKTLVAGVIARELGLELFQVDLSKVMSKWIGETERNLSQIFDAAEDGQVVLLFDEADSLFAKRTEVRSSNDRYANLEVNYLLQRLDAFEGIAILTTNAGTSIDQAFKRRMSFRLSFPFPDDETREQLWRAHMPPELPIEGTLALDALARKYQLSGGYIRNACLRAAFLAAQEETAVQQRHLERAVALEFAELGKLSSSGAID